MIIGFADRLDVSGVGGRTDIRQMTVQVTAVTDGIRSFTTTPYVFMADVVREGRYVGAT